MNVMCCFQLKNFSNFIQMISLKGKKLSRSYIILIFLYVILQSHLRNFVCCQNIKLKLVLSIYLDKFTNQFHKLFLVVCRFLRNFHLDCNVISKLRAFYFFEIFMSFLFLALCNVYATVRGTYLTNAVIVFSL